MNKKKKAVFFTIADENNLKWAKGLKRSFKHFHPDVDFHIYGPDYVADALKQDPDFFYKATPWIARDELKKYALAVKVDADSAVCATLDRIIDDESYQIGAVNNYNEYDAERFGLVNVWDIPPQLYVNCGLVAMRDRDFVEHWWTLCNRPNFKNYRYREQDLLNIMLQYGDYQWVNFDSDGDSLYSLASKTYWQGLEVDDKGDIVLPIIDGNTKEKVQEIKIRVIHWAEGNTPHKMNFGLRFPQKVADRLNTLTQYEKEK